MKQQSEWKYPPSSSQASIEKESGLRTRNPYARFGAAAVLGIAFGVLISVFFGVIPGAIVGILVAVIAWVTCKSLYTQIAARCINGAGAGIFMAVMSKYAWHLSFGWACLAVVGVGVLVFFNDPYANSP